MFLIRTAFWLSIAILFIPADQSEEQTERIELVSTGEAIMAAQSVWSDLSAICERKPDVCETGGSALQTFSHKAKNGARILYNYLDDGDLEAGAPEGPEKAAVKHANAPTSKPVMTSTVYTSAARS